MIALLLFFNCGSIFLYVFVKHYLGLDVVYQIHDTFMYVFTPIWDLVVFYQVYQACFILFMDIRFRMIILDKVDFDIILWISWLPPYNRIVESHTKTLTMDM